MGGGRGYADKQDGKVDFSTQPCWGLSVKTQECPLHSLWWGVNVRHLVLTGDGSTSSAQRGPSGRWGRIHLQGGQEWEDNGDFFQLTCCRLSHAISRGWTIAFFPWQAALKAAHAASQIVLGYCTSLPHQVFGFTTHSCWCLLTGERQDLLRFYVCLNFCPTLTRLVWRPVEIICVAG